MDVTETLPPSNFFLISDTFMIWLLFMISDTEMVEKFLGSYFKENSLSSKEILKIISIFAKNVHSIFFWLKENLVSWSFLK